MPDTAKLAVIYQRIAILKSIKLKKYNWNGLFFQTQYVQVDVDPDTEHRYMPSQWSRRTDVISKHVAITTKVSEEAKEEIPCRLNLRWEFETQ